MDCQFKEFCGKSGKRTHLIKGPGQADVEVLYLCTECLKKYQDSVKRLAKEVLTPEQNQEQLNQFRRGKFMTEITDNKILIPISHEDQKFVENVCTNGGYSFQTFFDHLLKLYRKSLSEPLTQTDIREELAQRDKETKKKSSKKDQ